MTEYKILQLQIQHLPKYDFLLFFSIYQKCLSARKYFFQYVINTMVTFGLMTFCFRKVRNMYQHYNIILLFLASLNNSQSYCHKRCLLNCCLDSVKKFVLYTESSRFCFSPVLIARQYVFVILISGEKITFSEDKHYTNS